jgi:hypothetical protein
MSRRKLRNQKGTSGRRVDYSTPERSAGPSHAPSWQITCTVSSLTVGVGTATLRRISTVDLSEGVDQDREERFKDVAQEARDAGSTTVRRNAPPDRRMHPRGRLLAPSVV